MWRRLRNIWFKELQDTVRDRRSMMQTILIPVVIGLLYALINPVLSSVLESRAEASGEVALRVPVVSLENAAGTELQAFMQNLDVDLVPYTGDLRAAVEAGDEGFGLVIPAGFAAAITAEEPANLQLLTNSSSGDVAVTSTNIARLANALGAYNDSLVAARLSGRGINPSILTGIVIDSESLTTPEQAGSFNARFMLPILIGVVVVSGGMFVALDVTAGEKERGTLEALLVTPASDREIFFGKLLAVYCVTLVPLMLTFIAYGAANNLLPKSMTDNAVVPLSTIIGGIVVGIPLALAVNVVIMILAIRAKTIKDAQSATTPLSLGILIPGLAPAFVPPAGLLAYLIPGYGSTAVLGDIAATGQFPVLPYLVSTLSCLLVVAVCVPIALRLFDRERLLYSM